MKYKTVRKVVKRGVKASLSLLFAWGFQSCFTGVESTGKITLSKKEQTVTAPSKEDLFLSDISFKVIGDWTPGKSFVVADDKFRMISEGAAANDILQGDTLAFTCVNERMSPSGGESTVILFDFHGESIAYSIDRNPSDVRKEFTVADMPMLIDLDAMQEIKSRLSGKPLWTKTALWYDEDMKYTKGKKFDKVTVTDVRPGTAFFPLVVDFRDEGGKTGKLFMNFGNSGNDSRSFGRLFSLTDPRSKYRHISQENWEAIQQEEVRLGMTKEECRLSKGNPSDVNSGHDYSNTVEIWYYTDGTYLSFIDGVLVNFK